MNTGESLIQLSETERVKWWKEAKFGMFIHWGLYAIPARGEWVMYRENVRIRDYENLLPMFNPQTNAVKQWARLAKEAGMRYMILTTKHHDGFCLFDSKLTKYTAVHSGARRDLVREFVEACRTEGLHVGLYYSIKDWRHPNYPFNPEFPLMRLEPGARKPDKDKYLSYMLGQLRELLTNYGKIEILWFDGRDPIFDGKAIGKEIRKYQPDILINERLIGNDPDFVTPEQMSPNDTPKFNGREIAWESCNTMTGQSWGYCRHEHEADFRSADKIIQMLTASVGAGGNFLLNVGPRPDGSLRPEEVKRLREIGKWMRKNEEAFRKLGSTPVKPQSKPATSRPRSTKPAYVVIKGCPLEVNADAEEAMWRKTPVIHVSQNTHYDAAKERYPAAARHGYCAYTVRAMHAGGMIYLLVEVESPSRLSYANAKSVCFYNCDVVHFLFAANMDLPRVLYNPEAFEIKVDALGQTWMPSEKKFPGAVFRHAVRPTERGYNVMLAMPLSMMRRRADSPKSQVRPGNLFRFNLLVTQPSPPEKAATRPGKDWWSTVPPDYTPYGERHNVYLNGNEGAEPMFNVQAWGIWRLEAE